MFQSSFFSRSLKWHHIKNSQVFWDVPCVKSVRIRNFSGPHFPAFGLNTERYSLSLRVHSECRKIRTRKTTNTEVFYAVVRFSKLYEIRNLEKFKLRALHVRYDCYLSKYAIHFSGLCEPQVYDGSFFVVKKYQNNIWKKSVRKLFENVD